MSAQEQWLREYRTLKTYISGGARKNQREIMRRYRREAALERKLAAAQRTIEAQERRIEQLEADVIGLEGELLIEGSMWVESAS